MNTISQDALSYIKENKKLLIEKFIPENTCPSVSNPFSVFMAGSPGAGKTEISTALHRQLVLANVPCCRIDADEIRGFLPQYKGKNSDEVQTAVSKGVNILLDYSLGHSKSFILDGTFAYGKSLDTVHRCIKHTYDIEIFYIHQQPEIAWKVTQARELEEGRCVPPYVFIQAYTKAIGNVKLVKDTYPSVELSVIVRDVSRSIKTIKYNVQSIDPYIDKIYNPRELEEIARYV